MNDSFQVFPLRYTQIVPFFDHIGFWSESTDRITNVEVFQRAKEETLLLKTLKNRRHLWIRHIIRHKEFVVNILEGAISGKEGCGKTSTTVLKASRQKHRR
jgi:hypothetical protein